MAADPLGLIGGAGGAGGAGGLRGAPTPQPKGPGFKQVLLDELNQANALQQDTTKAVEDLASGKRTDVENVILATQKADNAFRMLQSLRNRVMEAYEEVKQVRV